MATYTAIVRTRLLFRRQPQRNTASMMSNQVQKCVTSFESNTCMYSTWDGQGKCESSASNNYKSLKKILSLLGVSLAGILSLCWYYSKRSNDGEVRDIHHDPYCNGNSGVLVKSGDFWLPMEFFKTQKKVQQIRNFIMRGDDVVVSSFPKSGTTWVQQIVYLILTDLKECDNYTIEERFPYIEYIYPGLKSLTKASSPRCMKTHLPYELLPVELQTGIGNVIYIARNAKDVSVSYYHFIKMLTVTGYKGEFLNFFNSFLIGQVAYGPWSDHVLQYWQNRDKKNMLFITYEDLHKNPVLMIKKIADFLERPIDDKKALDIAYRSSFNQMKMDPTVNYSWWDEIGIRDTSKTSFMRKGKVGDWTNYYNKDMVQRMDRTCLEPLGKHGLIFSDK